MLWSDPEHAVVSAGHRAVGMVGAPAIHEQPLHAAIAHARDWNRVLQQATAVAQNRLVQQAGQLEIAGSHTDGEALLIIAKHTAPVASQTDYGNQSSGTQEERLTTDAAQAQHAQHAGGHSQLSASSQAQHAQYDSKSARGAEALQAAEGAQSASHTQSHQRAGSQNSSSTAPESDLESHQGSSPAQPMSPQPKLTPNLEGSDAQSTDSTQAQPASVDQQQRLAPEADQKQKLMPAPHLQPQQQQLGQQQQQQQQQRRQQLMAQLLSSKRMMPPSFPLVDDVRCVLGGRQQLSMLDSLQGLMAGLVVKALTSQVWTPHANLQLLRLTAAQTYSCSDTFPRACCMRASS